MDVRPIGPAKAVDNCFPPAGKGRPLQSPNKTAAALPSSADGVDGPSYGIVCARVMVVSITRGGAAHMNATTIGFDIAKGVIQIHGVDAFGRL